MDLIPLIDSVAEPRAALIGGIALGLVFGIAAQRSGFYTRSAVLDLTRGRDLCEYAANNDPASQVG